VSVGVVVREAACARVRDNDVGGTDVGGNDVGGNEQRHGTEKLVRWQRDRLGVGRLCLRGTCFRGACRRSRCLLRSSHREPEQPVEACIGQAVLAVREQLKRARAAAHRLMPVRRSPRLDGFYEEKEQE
jgi:hypothetical protein